MKIYRFFRFIIFLLDPEIAHNLSRFLLKYNLIPRFKFYNRKSSFKKLSLYVNNINFSSPIGLAAGFDKNGEFFHNLYKFGFSFIEIGTATYRKQYGNNKPRIFRLEKEESLLNHLGFNNDGIEIFKKNLNKNLSQIDYENNQIAINIGKNKDTIDDISDYIKLLDEIYPYYKYISYIAINISSPNTKKLRNIMNKDNLSIFIKDIITHKEKLAKKYNHNINLAVKIAPDLNDQQLKDVANILVNNNIDLVIISNSSNDYNLLNKNKYHFSKGGISGKLIKDKSDNILKKFFLYSEGKVKIIAVGGISSAADVITKIQNGASLCQLYSALIYNGFSLIDKILKDLDKYLTINNFDNIEDFINHSHKNLLK